MIRIREAQVHAAVTQSLAEGGYTLRSEFPLLGRVADIYALHTASGMTIAVECKERDWSRAIRQARVYQGAADFVYVALPECHVSENARRAVALHGLGLLVLSEDGRVSELVSARRAEHLVPLLLTLAKERFGACLSGTN